MSRRALSEMKIYILDIVKSKADYAAEWFRDKPNVKVVNQSFEAFMSDTDVECVVSPGNAYGIMDGGYDYAITSWFGEQLTQRVRKHIIDNFCGEQLVGTSFIIDAGKGEQKLIHTPTMRTPQEIIDPAIVYQCMRSTLMCAMDNDASSVVIPLFGCSTGGVEARLAAELMLRAYEQLENPPKQLDWDYAREQEILLIQGPSGKYDTLYSYEF